MTDRMLDFTVDALATYRIARLVAQDDLTAPLRERVRDSNRFVGRLVQCPHCVGVWAAGGVLVARLVAPRLWGPVARGLACAAVASVLAETAP